MFAASALEPIAPVVSSSNYRVAAPGVERSLLPQAAPASPASPDTKNSGQNANSGNNQPQQQSAPPPPAQRPVATMFAAAVLGGSLSPRPQTVNDVYMRIGTAPMSSDTEAKLHDLTA